MKHIKPWAVFFAMAGLSFGQVRTPRQPIIDVHLHSESLLFLKNLGSKTLGVSGIALLWRVIISTL